ncbi:MAG: FAD-dependent oxidoreductase [Chloroflexi bacterium]|nr:FAD-dependent oxidoreductase [Chloroflexota bacterium]
MKTAKTDVVIVGAGAIGCAIAYFLSRQGVKVIIVEKDSLGDHASGHAPGILNPQVAIPEYVDIMLPLTTKSFQLHQELYPQLLAETGVDYYFRRSALLGLAFTQAEAQETKDEIGILQKQGFETSWLDGDAVRLIDSRISPEVIGAEYSQDAGELDSYRYVLALAQAAEKYGAEIRNGRFTGLKRKGAKLTGVQLSSGEIGCASAVLAMGPWTGQASSSLGLSIPIRPQKGQNLRVRAPGPPFATLLAWDASYNTTTRQDGLVYHGATHEDVGFDEEPSAEGRDELINSLVTMVPSLVAAEVVLQTACLRPLAADGLPILGEVPGWNGVYLATGHWTKGILLSPVTGYIISELILGKAAPLPIEPFSVARFNSARA